MSNERKGFKNTLRNSLQNRLVSEEQNDPINPVKQGEPEKPSQPIEPEKPVNMVNPNKLVKYTVDVEIQYIEMIKREAFWERDTEKRIINELLRIHCENLNYEPIPETKKATKRGPKPKKNQG